MKREEGYVFESSTELKYQLLDELFSIGGNHKPDESRVVKSKLQDYAENNRDDLQIRDALIVLKTFEIESKNNDFETCCILAIPIFERLARAQDWDFYDIRLLTFFIDYAKTLERADFLASKALEKLENYSHEKYYKTIKSGILLNMTLRLIREKSTKKHTPHFEDELAEMFSKYINSAKELCEETDTIQKAVILIRKGIFYKDISLADEGFDLLKENREYEAYKLLRDEAIDYKLAIYINEDDKKQIGLLFDELFSMGGNHRPDKSKTIKSKLQSYFENDRNNHQIRDALIVLKIFDIESKYNDFETCCKLATPIFERLERALDWDFYDIRILTCVIDYAETIEQARFLVTKILGKLENYSDKKDYKNIKLGILTNMTFRLIRERFSKKDKVQLIRERLSRKDNYQLGYELDDLFTEYSNSIIELCDEADIIHRAIVLVRSGIFYRNKSLANQGFNLLKENGEHEAFKLLQDESRTYRLNVHLNKDDKQQFDVLMGENIRNIRTKHNMTVSDMAKNLNMKQGAVSLIELGKKSASAYILFSMAKILNESVENFFYDDETILPDYDSENALIEKLNMSAKDLSEDEFECVLDLVKGLNKLKNR